MLLQAFVEVHRAHDRVGDGEDHENEGDDGKTGEILSDWQVRLFVSILIHSEELEDKICSTTEVQDNGGDHAEQVFPAC